MKTLIRLLMFWALTAAALAQPALYFTQPLTNTTLVTNEITAGLEIFGSSFQPAVVEQLGMFDNFGEIQEPHIVGLWKVETECSFWPDYRCNDRGVLVASTSFEPGDDAFRTGGYRFHPIPPLQLEPNTSYIIATHYSRNSPDPIPERAPEHTPYLPVPTGYRLYRVAVTNAFVGPSRYIYADEQNFASGNVIFSTNRAPVAQAVFDRMPHPIGNTFFPWLVNTNDEPVALVLDARQSSDPENEPLNFQWLLSGNPPTPLGEGAVFTNLFPAGQEFVLKLRVADGLQHVDAYYGLQTHSPGSAIAAMREMVLGSRAGRSLRARLLAPLRNADAFFRRHRTDRALARLQKLEERVGAHLQTLDEESAEKLLDAATAIREAFQGEVGAPNPEGIPL